MIKDAFKRSPLNNKLINVMPFCEKPVLFFEDCDDKLYLEIGLYIKERTER